MCISFLMLVVAAHVFASFPCDWPSMATVYATVYAILPLKLKILPLKPNMFHPVSWVAVSTAGLCLSLQLFTDTRYLAGNLVWWHWCVLVLLVAMSAWHSAMNKIRVAIESVASATRSVVWLLAWVVFILQMFSVATRYGNDLVAADILFSEVNSLVWQTFAVMFLSGLNYGVRDAVNPRIDFWWTNFSIRTKAVLDFTFHTLMLLPCIYMAVRVLQSYSATALGRNYSGEWVAGWRVWQSWEQSAEAGGLPVGPIKSMMLVGFVLFGLQVIAEIIKTGFILIGNDDYGDITEHATPHQIE